MTPSARRRGVRPSTIVSALAVLVVAGSACLDDSITGVRELSMALTAGATVVSAGDSVTFDYTAEGNGLVWVYVEYGDGGADTATFSGGFEEPDEEVGRTDTLFYPDPIEVGGTLIHAFDSVGTFPVVGYAVSAAGVATDTVTLTVR